MGLGFQGLGSSGAQVRLMYGSTLEHHGERAPTSSKTSQVESFAEPS